MKSSVRYKFKQLPASRSTLLKKSLVAPRYSST